MSDTEAVDTAAVQEQAAESVDAWISGDPAKIEWAERPDNGEPDRKPGDLQYVADPRLDAEEAQAAPYVKMATTLSELGPEGEALVQEWGGHSSPDFQENIAYARNAFRDIAANRPDLIAKVDASGLGNDPAILKLLSELGRQQAHTLGDFTVQRNRNASFDEPQRALPRGQSAAQRELHQIFEETPPGTKGYAKPSVQNRILQLNEMIHGNDDIVGAGGRTS